MSTMLDKIIEEVRQLPPDEREQLRGILNDETSDAERTRRIALSRSIRGKYREVLTSSEEFIARKAVEIAKEDRAR
jgi:hypothetical protein